MKKGIYLLIIENSEKRKIKAGALGQLNFKKGYYVYVGSGQNNLEKRIKRHKSQDKKKHWHIDYILQEMQIKSTFKFKSKKECKLAKIISKLSNSYVRDFGCSDCNCPSHLFYFKNNPTSLIQKKEQKLNL